MLFSAAAALCYSSPCGLLQSTYCSNVVKYCQESKRTVHVVNLDPAAENFTYDPVVGESFLLGYDKISKPSVYLCLAHTLG